MPAIGTRGGMSARGFGLFGLKKPGFLTGALGLFSLGNNSAQTLKYAWSPETSSAGQSFSQTIQQTGAGANSNLAIFSRGTAEGTGKQTQQYTWGSDATQAATGFSAAFYRGSATSTSTFGYFFMGGSSPTTSVQLYNYSAGAAGAASVLSSPVNYVCALGEASKAIVSAANINGNSAATIKYLYGSGASAGTSFLASRPISTGYVGNATVGVFFVTAASTTATQLYTYAGDTTAVGGTLNSGSFDQQQGCGNATYGIVAGSTEVRTFKYTYATNTVTTALAFPNVPFFGGATNNGLSGVNA